MTKHEVRGRDGRRKRSGEKGSNTTHTTHKRAHGTLSKGTSKEPKGGEDEGTTRISAQMSVAEEREERRHKQGKSIHNSQHKQRQAHRTPHTHAHTHARVHLFPPLPHSLTYTERAVEEEEGYINCQMYAGIHAVVGKRGGA